MTPLRAVIFDFGGVLSFHPLDEYIARAAKTLGVPVPEFVQAFWANRIPYDAGELSPEQYWAAVARSLNQTFRPALVPKMVEHEIEFWSRYDSRVLDWIRELRAQGKRIGILSNLPSPLGKHLRGDTKFMSHFDHVTFSNELNMVKPQSAIYEHAVRGLGVAPSEALFLDDRRENVDGAIAAGLRAELYETWETFDRDSRVS